MTGLGLMIAGLLMQKRNSSPYSGGQPMDAPSRAGVGRGQALCLLGTACYLIDVVFFRG